MTHIDETVAAPNAGRTAVNRAAWVAGAAGEALVRRAVQAGPLGAEEVEISVEHCGLCHSDLSVLKNAWGISRFPATLGHEVVGRVTSLGAGARGLSLGQRVGVGWMSRSCMHCRYCMSGNHHLCPEVQLTVVGHEGGFATHIRSHWAWVVPLPEGSNAADAGPLMCGGVTVFAPIARYAKPTDRVGIIGIGGLGHLAVQFAAAFGCDVTAFTSSEGKFEEARRFGAASVVSTADASGLKKLHGKFDLLLSTVNVPLDWGTLIDTLAGNGRFHLVGAVLEPIPVSVFPLLVGQRSVSASPAGSPIAIRETLEFAARHRISPQTEHFPMSRINEAFARLESGRARYRIVLDADF